MTNAVGLDDGVAASFQRSRIHKPHNEAATLSSKPEIRQLAIKDEYGFIKRISLTGFPAQIVGSSNTDVLDSPCLLVLITGTSQSRQHGKSESDSYYLSD
ncbi:hypothetical protein Tco_1120125 [Tanacetum coccineum]